MHDRPSCCRRSIGGRAQAAPSCRSRYVPQVRQLCLDSLDFPSRRCGGHHSNISNISYRLRKNAVVVKAAKELHFNKNMEALKKMQAGADKLATVVGVTIGPKVPANAGIMFILLVHNWPLHIRGGQAGLASALATPPTCMWFSEGLIPWCGLH